MNQVKQVIIQQHDSFMYYLLLYHQRHGIDVNGIVFVKDIIVAVEYIIPDHDQLLIIQEGDLINTDPRRIQSLINLNPRLICVLYTANQISTETIGHSAKEGASNRRTVTNFGLASLIELFLDGSLCRNNPSWRIIPDNVKQLVANE